MDDWLEELLEQQDNEDTPPQYRDDGVEM